MKRPDRSKEINESEDSEKPNYKHRQVVYHYYQFADSGEYVTNDNVDTISMLHSIKLDVLKTYSKDPHHKKKSDIIELNYLKKAWLAQSRKKGD